MDHLIALIEIQVILEAYIISSRKEKWVNQTLLTSEFQKYGLYWRTSFEKTEGDRFFRTKMIVEGGLKSSLLMRRSTSPERDCALARRDGTPIFLHIP